jgi:hypothetical protein
MANLAEGELCLRRLTLMAFLIAHETRCGGGESFYAFIPHRSGPVSFTLNHEVGKLAESDLIQYVGEEGLLCPASRALDHRPDKLDGELRRRMRELRSVPTEKLASRVALRHPEYIAGKRPKNDSAPDTVYTKGYEGLSVDRFLGDLIEAGIQAIVDVRNHPASRRFGFHKRTLCRLAEDANMNYYHFPEIGIPSSERRDVTSDSEYAELLDWYETALLPREGRAVGKIAAVATAQRSVLVCSESNAEYCHRSRLAVAVAGPGGLDIVHI